MCDQDGRSLALKWTESVSQRTRMRSQVRRAQPGIYRRSYASAHDMGEEYSVGLTCKEEMLDGMNGCVGWCVVVEVSESSMAVVMESKSKDANTALVLAP